MPYPAVPEVYFRTPLSESYSSTNFRYKSAVVFSIALFHEGDTRAKQKKKGIKRSNRARCGPRCRPISLRPVRPCRTCRLRSSVYFFLCLLDLPRISRCGLLKQVAACFSRSGWYCVPSHKRENVKLSTFVASATIAVGLQNFAP